MSEKISRPSGCPFNPGCSGRFGRQILFVKARSYSGRLFQFHDEGPVPTSALNASVDRQFDNIDCLALYILEESGGIFRNVECPGCNRYISGTPLNDD